MGTVCWGLLYSEYMLLTCKLILEIMEDDEDDAADSDEADLSTEGSAEEAVPPTEAKQDDLPQTHSPSLS